MTDTKVTPYPETPAEVASAVLEAIEKQPHTLSMGEWYYHPDRTALPPSDEPDCGTAMCVAGWAAHVTGWTLVGDHHATKDGRTRTIEFVGTAVLGLDDETNGLFWFKDEEALAKLREIAGR